MRVRLSPVWMAVFLAACATPAPLPWLPSERAQTNILREELLRAAPPTPPVHAGVTPPVLEVPDPLAQATVTLRGAEIPLGDVLMRLARPTGLTLVIEPEVDGRNPVNLDLHTLPVRDALRAVLSPFGYTFRVESMSLIVFAFETRVWNLSLPPHETEWEQRVTNSSTTTGGQQAPGTTSGVPAPTGTGTTPSGGTGSVQLGSTVSLRQRQTNLSFWSDVEDAMKRMVSQKGWYALNRAAGTITVRERPDRLAEIDRYFQSVESEVARQVQVEVKVLEVTLTGRDALGIDWQRAFGGLLDSGRGRLSLGLGATAQLLPGATLPFSLIFRSGSDQLIIKALGQQGTVRVLSQPKLLISNNHAAVIQVGQVRSFVASLATTVSGTAASTQTSASLGSVQDGVILGLTPRVYGREVVMTVTPVVTRVNEIRRIALSQNNVIEAPDLNSRALSTTVRIPDGDTGVLGGLINEDDRVDEAGLPWLRRIPLLGWLLFGFRDQRATRSEIVVLLTPSILKPVAFTPGPPPPAAAPPAAPLPAPGQKREPF